MRKQIRRESYSNRRRELPRIEELEQRQTRSLPGSAAPWSHSTHCRCLPELKSNSGHSLYSGPFQRSDCAPCQSWNENATDRSGQGTIHHPCEMDSFVSKGVY